jgi:glycosyltransferase involved in cell wall biosynthesis
MDFTIITANLNHGRFLRDCLASVASQEGVSVQHLVIDGGSTDDSQAIVESFPQVVWSQGKDKGMSDAINKGFDRARGTWVMWLNADDRLKPGALARIKQAAEESTADVIYGDYDFVDESGNFLRSVKVPGWSPFVNVHHHCYIGSTACFFHRVSVLEQGHRLREDFHYVMDGEFFARLHERGLHFTHVPVVVAEFRMHGGNASLRYLGKTRDVDAILKAERQHVESRAIRRAYGLTLFEDPYLNGLSDGVLWMVARAWKGILKLAGKFTRP